MIAHAVPYSCRTVLGHARHLSVDVPCPWAHPSLHFAQLDAYQVRSLNVSWHLCRIRGVASCVRFARTGARVNARKGYSCARL